MTTYYIELLEPTDIVGINGEEMMAAEWVLHPGYTIANEAPTTYPDLVIELPEGEVAPEVTVNHIPVNVNILAGAHPEPPARPRVPKG